MLARIFCAAACVGALSGCSASGAPGTDAATGATAGSGSHGGSAGSAGSETDGGAGSDGGFESALPNDPGAPVTLKPTAPDPEQVELEQKLSGLEGLPAAGIGERYPTSFQAAPAYDLSKVAGLDLIQKSSLKLNDAELQLLQKNGFAIAASWMPTHSYGYSSIYLQDLPVYISADSILDAVHRSYDSMLKRLEQDLLIGELSSLLAGMHQNLGSSSDVSDDVRIDADLFLTVARSLLTGKAVTPLVGSNARAATALVARAVKAQGVTDITLFGVRRANEDFSQFKPRGHYTDTPELANYFRAMIWLGRIDFRLLETQDDGTQLFRRRQLESAVALRSLMGGALDARFRHVDAVISAFVGESDYMTPTDVDALLKQLGIGGAPELVKFTDTQLAQALADGNFGMQRISSHILISPVHTGTFPLSRSFALFGQRYVLDSHVFSNVVYDRVSGDPSNLRLMPNPLDVAFAALGNDQAGTLLSEELTRFESAGYPAALAQTRTLADTHGSDYWKQSLYTSWLGALRELSPQATSGAADAATLFPIARSEAWGRRLLNTQLSSWAELRHDTILYAKQSYSSGAACDFPDGYVDPYPGFFAALSGYADRGKLLVDELQLPSGALSTAISTYFELLGQVSQQLGGIAEHERSGAALTAEMLAFINDAVQIGFSCTNDAPVQAGWYKKLFFDVADSANMKPTIADVHTQPTDEAGNLVGHVLHVGTAAPHELVVIAEGCSGPRAYVGYVTSYRERITQNFERTDDIQWQGIALSEPEVAWMADLVGKQN